MPIARGGLVVSAGLVILGAALTVSFLVPHNNGTSLWSGLALEIQTLQRDLHRQLAAAIQAVRREGAAAAGTLVVLSFLYGVFHAVGPGHGKVIISTYLLTQESQLRRGVVLADVVRAPRLIIARQSLCNIRGEGG